MQANYPKSLDFLRRWGAPWVLTAIEVDRKGIETKTFRREEDVLAWLNKQGNLKRNLYFHVNSVTRDLDKKAERTDIKSLDWLHIDIDPRIGEDITEERARALRALRNPPEGVPPPTVIVYSGGGYQGYWKLRKPLPIGGNLEKAEDAKRYNLQIEILFQADSCHNIDRIMRLPGTINWPNAQKRKKGQESALARVEEWHEDRVYDLAQFAKAPKVQGAENGFAGSGVKISGNVRRLSGVDELPEGVTDRIKVLIVQGSDPDDPTKYASRSEALFAVVCGLVRGGCTDDEIYSVITDPSFEISKSVLETGSGVERYATRQIERAREHAEDPWLRKLNDKHAVIRNWSGKCRVIEEQYDDTIKRHKLTKQSFAEFRNGYSNHYLETGEKDRNGNAKFTPVGSWWLANPKRRQYDTLVFAPERDVPGAYNLWKGFACEARPGDCSLYLEHIRTNICDGNEEHYEYLLSWMALAVQEPAQQGHTAIVMRGRQGTGKGVFASTFGSLWGRHYLHVTDPKHLMGSFNAHRRDCVVLFADEAFFAGDKKHESILKALITENTFQVEHKGVDAEVAPNFSHLLMASNEDWVVPAGANDRRFFGLDVNPAHMQNKKYFTPLLNQIEDGGREALLHLLMTRDISNFDVRAVPKTAMLQSQKELSMKGEADWWFEKLQDGCLLEDHEVWEHEISKTDLQYNFVEYIKNFSNTSRSNQVRLAHFLKRVLPKGFPKTIRRRQAKEIKLMNGSTFVSERPRYYVFPPLEICRESWDESNGSKTTWPVIKVIEGEKEHEDY